MKVRNKSTEKIITLQCAVAATFLSRLQGLMFSSYQSDLLLVSPKDDIPSSSIHMFLMRFPLDVIWINSKMQVVDIKKEIPPLDFLKPKTWKIYKPKEPAKYVLELKTGKIANSDSKVGDKVEFLTSHS